MKSLLPPATAALCAGLFFWSVVGPVQSQSPPASAAPAATPPAKPLKALLIAGGCCHDYARQFETLSKGIQGKAHVQVDVLYSSDTSTKAAFDIYRSPDWAKGYDVVIHDECSADIKDPAYVKNILDAHKSVPAVNLHCAMHSYRTGSDEWFRFVGIQSSAHGPQEPIAVEFVNSEHPVTAGLANWTTIKEELYNNLNIFPTATPLATGEQKYTRGGKEVTEKTVVAWANEFGGTRVFSTTLGHNNQTVGDDRYLELVTRGLLWATGKSGAEWRVPFKGENTVRKIDPLPAPKKAAAVTPAPADAVPVTISASSVQSGNGRHGAIDNDPETRWCAYDSGYPQWIRVDFDPPRSPEGIRIDWEQETETYRFTVEGSADGQNWEVLADGSQQNKSGAADAAWAARPLRAVRINCLGSSRGGWASIREIRFSGAGLAALRPAGGGNAGAGNREGASDPYEKGGNSPPVARALSAAEEAGILRDAKVADGFEATVFAAPPMVNYPVYVAASPDGTLFVSSDGNGSLGRDPHRGRILRLRDTNHDGRADEVKEYVKDVDSPRGLVWDQDRLYLVHPPHLSAFIDHDGDGISDEQKILVRDIAFGFKDRPADHTTNGLSLGMDGWLYIAGGDFGFLQATGSDGRKLQHRGGGVIRVRPDGTGLEMYSTGTRNILEVAISPEMDIFARDNTNDGGGWNVRFHHFTGLDDHGYPRLYRNFSDECLAPLADYGGGSGCGAVYIDEPGFPSDWNHAPFTADWGTNAIYHHAVRPKGATFEETTGPRPLVRMTRPTDADVDAQSRVYGASWKGATFNWAGPDVGYILCIRPKGFVPDPLPDFGQASDDQLARLLKAPSYRVRLEAQRRLQRRGSPLADEALRSVATSRTPERNLVAGIKEIADRNAVSEAAFVAEQTAHADPVVSHVALHALAALKADESAFAYLDRSPAASTGVLRALALRHTEPVVSGLATRLAAATDPGLRRGLLAALCRLHYREGDWKGDSWGTRPDTRGPYYQPEKWDQSDRIASLLNGVAGSAAPEEAAYLAAEMARNRIQSDAGLDRLITLVDKDSRLLPLVAARLAKEDSLPSGSLPVLVAVVRSPDATAATLVDAVTALAKVDGADAARASLAGLGALRKAGVDEGQVRAARRAFQSAPQLENAHQVFEQVAAGPDSPESVWAEVALLELSGRLTGSPEAREQSALSLDAGWKDPARRARIIEAVRMGRAWLWSDRVLSAVDDPDRRVARAARTTVEALKLKKRGDAPVIGDLNPEEVVTQVSKLKGDAELGEAVFAKATCAACHTVREDETQKGPFLGNIAATYNRADLARNILDPNRTIAQGFATNIFTLKDGRTEMGFVTLEAADRVTYRTIAAQEHTVPTTEIQTREKAPISLMPPGLISAFTVEEFAGLLEYLEALRKKG